MLRIYLTGRMALECADTFLDAGEFPGQQGRVVFAYLVAERARPVARSELIELLWPRGVPPAGQSSLTAIVSKLRALFTRAGMDGASVLTGANGCYELRLPGPSWVDVDAAADSVHEAEAALKSGDPGRAYGPSAVAHHIARRPFLPGEEGPWIEQRRDRLRNFLLRALECRAEIYLWNQEHSLAVEAAREAISLAPFRESAYRLLMRAHVAAGNAAEALRVYERCRTLISEELGVLPSPETRAVHAGVLMRM